MSALVWKFDKVLHEHGISPAQLEREIVQLGYDFGAKTIYRFTGAGPGNVNRGSLEAILVGLRSITGKDLNVQDLLEFEA